MTDKEALFLYRLEQAETTLQEAERMFNEHFSARSIINRAYYAMFYMVLALLIAKDVPFTTSKHTGIISIFDKEFILNGILDKKHSKALHKMFDRRLEFDYKELVMPSESDVVNAISSAESFIAAMKAIV